MIGLDNSPVQLHQRVLFRLVVVLWINGNIISLLITLLGGNVSINHLCRHVHNSSVIRL